MKRLRKDTGLDGTSEKADKGCRPEAGEPRNHDDQGTFLTRVIGRSHLKPLLVTRSSGDVEVFDRFILQLLRAKGIAKEPADRSQVFPFVCLMPFRPMFVSPAASSSGGQQPTPDGLRHIFQISPVSIRTYIADLLTQPVLLETFMSRGRDLGLAEVRQSILHDELFRMVQLLDLAAAEDQASLESEERQLHRKRCEAARQAAKMKEAAAAAAAAAGDSATGGIDALDECLPRCEDLIVIGVGYGKGGHRKESGDLEKRGSSDGFLRRLKKEGKPTGAGEAGEQGGGQGDGQGDGQGAGQGGGEQGGGQGRGLGDILIMKGAGSEGRKGKKKKRKKKKKGGKGGIEDGDGDDEEEEEKQHKEEDEHDAVGGYGDDDDDESDLDLDSIGTDDETEEFVDWDGKLKYESPVSAPSPPAVLPKASLRTFVLPPRGSILPRGSMYSLQFTPAFVFSYFQTMPPHYSDNEHLLLLFDQFGGKPRPKEDSK